MRQIWNWIVLLASIFLVNLTLAVAQEAKQSIPAVDIKAADIQAILQQQIASKKPGVDTPIRTMDAGGYNVGVAINYRRSPALGGSASHDKVTEVYYILEGAGKLVTGGTLVDARRREGNAEEVTQINGPGTSGSKIQGGVSRRISKGDTVIIPAGTAHWWSEIEGPSITYLIMRVDPDRVVALK